MPGTYTRILFHIVFSTKRRAPFITPDRSVRLHDYIGGIIRAEGGEPLAIGGMPDHVHILLLWRPDAALSDLMRTLKARSSGWVHRTFPEAEGFAWQEGYAGFSVSRSGEADVRAYIANQAEHHGRRSFSEELLALLRVHGVEFDPRYVND